MKKTYIPVALLAAAAITLAVSFTTESSSSANADSNSGVSSDANYGASSTLSTDTNIKTITVDQGVVKVHFDSSIAGYNLSYAPHKRCPNTKIEIEQNEQKDGLSLSHTGESCYSSPTFTITLGKGYQGKPIKIALDAGMLELPKDKALYNKATFAVDSGMISSDSFEPHCGRGLSNPAKVSCSYAAATKQKDGYDLEVTVDSGMINL